MNKDNIRKFVKKLPIEFREIKEMTFSMNDITTKTIIFEYGGEEFVFVDGAKNVELGWSYEDELGDAITKGIEKYNKEQLDYLCMEENDLLNSQDLEIHSEDLEYYTNAKNEISDTNKFIHEFKTYLDSKTSNIRKVDIKPMLVEVLPKILDKNMSYDDVIKQVEKPFRLPTEDEWEYICSGGKRTLLRFGDKFTSYEVMNFIYSKEDKTPLDEPNMFGVIIADNSYLYELLSDSKYVKGGDGGKSICGGEGIKYVFPCYTSFYREYKENIKKGLLSKYFYSFRRVILLEE